MGIGKEETRQKKTDCQICNCKLAENRYFQKQAYVSQIFIVDEKPKGI